LAVIKSGSGKRLLLCINATLQKKAKDIIVLNVKDISSFTDYMIICSGVTERQVQAISAAIQEYLKKAGIKPLGIEGEENAQWVLLDYDDVVISIFKENIRLFYDIENLWDAPKISIDSNKTKIKHLNEAIS
jgi:ribosome-associated protein